ncbi:MAG: hypothetical protein Q7S27_03655 [Nanoarchaeota archaeon]|nr:hypothetical protein [Nanoarchaeota archaeon]
MGINFKLNKRGIIFTTLVVLILFLFVISLTFYSVIKERKAIRDRIETMNAFIPSLEKDMGRQLYISSYRSLLSIESYIGETGNFVTSAENSIGEALLNGTINNLTMGLMEGYKLSEWQSRVSELGNKVNTYINYSVINVTVAHSDPWHILIKMRINITIEDKGNVSKWQKIEIIKTNLKIEGFEDPLYLIETNGLISNKVLRTPYSSFVIGSDLTNLSLHVNNSYYISSPAGPSFLDRLEGKTSASTNGVESLVNLAKLSSQGIATSDKSIVDFIYFSSSNPTACNVIPAGMPSWFKLDENHLATYEVDCSS